MKIGFSIVILLLLAVFACGAAAEESPVLSPAWAQKLGDISGAEQIAFVGALGDSHALFSMHEKDEEGNWRLIVSTNAFIGQQGLGKTQVGDMKTPLGLYTLDCAFGIEADPGCALPYHQVTENDYWSGDEHCHYNQMVDIRDYPSLDTGACEHLTDMGAVYNYCLNIGYNPNGVPGAGAAIFLHCQNPAKPYTAGCVAIPEADMRTVLRHIRPGCMIAIDSFDILTGVGK